jgi:dTDP-4-amino-4,6-dideoxygalactose transaminase
MAAELAPIRGELDAAIARVLDSGIFIGGDEVAGFERELAAATHAAHAIGVSSGTDALLAVLMALGVGPGDEVVTTPFTFFATIGAVLRVGARVVFADIDDAMTLDPEAALSACSPRTRAILPVHLFGRTARIPSAPCAIVEDAAQAIGAPLGPIATLSFFPTKNLGALGDAGAVIVDDDTLADRVKLVRGHGARPKYHHLALGGNFRLDALQAAVLRAKLAHLGDWTAARRRHAAAYRAAAAATRLPDELHLPGDHASHVYHQFVIRAPRRDALAAHLASSGIGTEIYYPEPLHLQPCVSGYRRGAFPAAERAAREVLALPIHPMLAHDTPARVIDAIAAFYR